MIEERQEAENRRAAGDERAQELSSHCAPCATKSPTDFWIWSPEIGPAGSAPFAAVAIEQRVALLDRERLQPHHVARQFLGEAGELVGQRRRGDQQQQRGDENEHDQDDQRGDEAAEAEALHAPHDRIEQIAERDAGGERRDRAAEQVEQIAERRQRDRPNQDLAFEGHGADLAWRLPAAADPSGRPRDRRRPRRFRKLRAAAASRKRTPRALIAA